MAAKNRHNHIDCLGSALPDEEYFVLLARDPAMPALLGIWSSLRVGNLQAATENFMLLMAPDLVSHYQRHPDIAKSQEAVDTANRAAEWRERNLDGPDGKPTWKQSLVRPQMLDVEPQVIREFTVLPGLPQPPEPEPGPAQEICPVCQEFTCECDISHENAPAIR